MIEYAYDIEQIKNELSVEQIQDIVAELGGEPKLQDGILMCRTICHGGSSHKLYYYWNTHLFHCYTDCSESFDIFTLVHKVMKQKDNDYTLAKAVEYVASYFHYAPTAAPSLSSTSLDDYLISLKNYDRIKNIDNEKQIVELKIYDGSFLKHLPQVRILNWEQEGITKSTMDFFNIHYEPKNNLIVIPHEDINGNLIGVRQRTLIAEDADKYGKYRPLFLNGKTYNHPLSFNLYGIKQNADNIKRIKKAIILEGEKSVLQLEEIMGRMNNIGVAICGSAFVTYQAKMLIDLGVEEIIVGLDKQYQIAGDAEYNKLVKNLMNIYHKYGQYVKISYLFDDNNLLPYKASPTDLGKDVFAELYRDRRDLY